MEVSKKTLKKLFLFWLIFVVSISTYVLMLNLLGLTSVKVADLKELLFAVWGYNWDGSHYIKIALQGYSYPLQAFFPLYPLIVSFFAIFLPLTLAYRINVLLGFALVGVLYLFSMEMGLISATRKRVVVLFLAFPTAFFLQANYNETLFIIVAVIGLLFLSRRKYLLAAVLAGLLTAVKVSGLALSLVVVFSYIYHNKNNLVFPKILLYTVIGVSGILLYFLYLHSVFGSVDVFFEAQRSWGRISSFHPISILQGFYIYSLKFMASVKTLDVALYRFISELLIFVGMLVLLVKSFGKLKLEFWVYSVLQVLIPLGTGSLLSFNRLSLLAFPIILWGASLVNSKKAVGLYVLVGISLQALGIYLFLNNVFVG